MSRFTKFFISDLFFWWVKDFDRTHGIFMPRHDNRREASRNREHNRFLARKVTYVVVVG